MKIVFWIILLLPLYSVAEWDVSRTERWIVTQDKLYVESATHNAAAQVFFIDGLSYIRLISETEQCFDKGDERGERSFVINAFSDYETIEKGQPINIKSTCIGKYKAALFPVSVEGHRYIINLFKSSNVVGLDEMVFSANNFTNAYNKARETSMSAL